MTLRNIRSPMTTFVLFFLFIGLFILGCGCLSSPSGSNAVTVDILEKSVGPADLGECAYQTLIAVANNGSTDIHGLSILIEIYDPGEREVAAREIVQVGDLRKGEVKNATSRLQAHCRMNYTIRVYAQY